jgi:hypothetical protein
MDDFQTRALGNLRKRHEDKIRQAAEEIREYAGYLLRDLGSGRTSTSSHYAGDILTDAREIVTRFAALEAIGDAVGILEATEG